MSDDYNFVVKSSQSQLVKPFASSTPPIPKMFNQRREPQLAGNSKPQIPGSKQPSNSNDQKGELRVNPVSFELWRLRFPWDLEPGAWDFRRGRIWRFWSRRSTAV
jgi:hypothetical protein